MFNGMNGLEILKNWPRYEDGEPVRFGDEIHVENERPYPNFNIVVDRISFDKAGFIELFDDSNSEVEYRSGERIKRPAPKVLDADGVEIRVGDRLYDTDTGCGRTVRAVNDNGTVEFEGYENRGWFVRFLTHQRPVLDADGVEIRVGDTVWHVKTGREYVVVEPSYGDTVVVRLATYNDAEGEQYAPDQLTHERPVADTWERIEEDAGKDPCGYFGFDGEEICGKCPASGKNCEQTMAQDLVRRCRALAGRERGE